MRLELCCNKLYLGSRQIFKNSVAYINIYQQNTYV